MDGDPDMASVAFPVGITFGGFFGGAIGALIDDSSDFDLTPLDDQQKATAAQKLFEFDQQ